MKENCTLAKKRTHNPTHCSVELASQTNREMNEKILDHQLVLPWIPASACTLLTAGLRTTSFYSKYLSTFPLEKCLRFAEKHVWVFPGPGLFRSYGNGISLSTPRWLALAFELLSGANKNSEKQAKLVPVILLPRVCVPWSSITWKMKSLAKCSARAYRNQIRLLGLLAWTKTLSGSSYSEELQAKPL